MTWTKTLEDYEVSEDGRIRNIHNKREIKQFVGKDGYLRTQIAGKTRLVHRVVAKAYIPEDPEREFVNHKDGNKQNNHVDNLEWSTKSENLRHAYQHSLKRKPVGTLNGRCKLTDDQVDFIRKNYIRGDKEYGARAMATKFGVAPQTICAVVTGQNWK